jgi:hypothetical protein
VNFLDEVEALESEVAKQLLRDRFSKNLNFFKVKDKKLFDKIGAKPTLFGLVADSGGVNILNLSTNTLVYPTDENGRHTAIASSIEMAKNPLSHTKWAKGFEINPFYMTMSQLEITANACKNIFGYAHTQGMNPTSISLSDSYMPFAAIYGLGGGFVLEVMLEEYRQIDSLFIYEPFDDFFAISAYFVDYEELYSRVGHLMLIVGEPPSSADIRTFLVSNRFMSLYPRLELTMYAAPQIGEVKNSVRIEAGSLFRGFGTYEDEMIGWHNSQKNCSYENLKYPVLTNPHKKLNFSICVVGNGASLDESIEFLRQNQEKMIIFSAGTALRTLLKNGIKPDFQIEIERTDYLGDILVEAGAAGVDMIAASVVDSNTLEASKAEKFIFFRDYTAISYLDAPKFLLQNSSPFVGNAALSLAVALSKSVFLCGVDVGYKRGKTIHSKDSIYEEETALPEGSVRVKANFEDSEVYSNHLFNLSRTVLEFAISQNKDVKVTNLSDGAFIMGATPRKEALPLGGDKTKAKELLKTFFSQEKEKVFGKNGLNGIEKEIDVLKNELLAIFTRKVENKRDFFEVIRIFEKFCAFKESKKDILFFLFGGSLKHMVFSLCVSVLHIEVKDFDEFYRNLCSCFFSGIEDMQSDFKKEIAKGKISNLLGGFKAP